MDTLKKLFPFSFKASEVKELIIAIVVYAVIDILCGLVIGLLSKIPITANIKNPIAIVCFNPL